MPNGTSRRPCLRRTGPRLSPTVGKHHPIPFDFETRALSIYESRRSAHRRAPRKMCPGERSAAEPDSHVGNVINVHARRRFEPRRNRHRRIAAEQPIHQVEDVPSVIDQNPAARRRRCPPLAAAATSAGGLGPQPIDRHESNRAQPAGLDRPARSRIRRRVLPVVHAHQNRCSSPRRSRPARRTRQAKARAASRRSRARPLKARRAPPHDAAREDWRHRQNQEPRRRASARGRHTREHS